ncbi:MAG: hypothetical protein HC886_22905 [Leptolyngbyaceae cyanobacterium SM1_1_3]|nr:hypothetical protein [Leptolyngbyaceae cyanobacterium SM1_1_3]
MRLALGIPLYIAAGPSAGRLIRRRVAACRCLPFGPTTNGGSQDSVRSRPSAAVF